MTNFTTLLLSGIMLTGVLASPMEVCAGISEAGRVEKQVPRKGIPVANKFPMAEGALITEVPEGVTTNWVINGYSYMQTWSGVSIEENINCVSQIVETSDNEVYVCGILPSSFCPGWVKGQRDGDIITIPVPQRVEEIPYGDIMLVYQIDVLNYIEGEPLDIFAFEVDESIKNITLSKTETGWHLDLPGNGSQILGLTYANEGEQIWVGYGNIFTNWSPLPWLEINAPSVEPTQYAMVYDGEGHLVNVAFDNNECYIQGISSYFPKGWIKGEIKDTNSIMFPSNQFQGITNVCEMGLFQGGIYGEVFDEYWGETYWDYIPQANAIFEYDPVAKSLTMSDQAVMINTSDTITKCLNIYWAPTLYPQPKDIVLVPQMPVAVEVSEFASGLGYGSVTFSLTNLNIDSFVIPQEELFYTVKIDGVSVDIYGDPLIPFAYNDYDIIRKYGKERNVRFYDEFAKTVEVEVIYLPKDGEEVHSPILVMSLDPSAIETVEAASEDVRYYDLMGRRIISPKPGSMVIKVVGGKSYKVII